ncbi:hypothetical protein GS4_11_00190 [Gordonia soli NBRC 108243]|uniref:Uncharacterized protein n=1 Tax=Gordonia soli NBRC 108243 TaxID=1223545 RepID=M0QHG0_9ACTN|nr:hypothetical protein GS4_11_00190 [Gordonia soli NBRC 108243]
MTTSWLEFLPLSTFPGQGGKGDRPVRVVVADPRVGGYRACDVIDVMADTARQTMANTCR